MLGAVHPGAFQVNQDLSIGSQVQSFGGEGRSGDVATQTLQAISVFRANHHPSVEVEPTYLRALWGQANFSSPQSSDAANPSPSPYSQRHSTCDGR